MFYIWSHRHSMWWKADRRGYAQDLALAGSYTRLEAADIVLSHMPGANVAVDEHLGGRFEGLNAEDVEKELEALRRL